MPEVIIKYKNSKTLQVLKSLAKYFDFNISSPTSKPAKKELTIINGVSLIRKSISPLNNTEMNDVFSRMQPDAKDLRKQWQRQK